MKRVDAGNMLPVQGSSQPQANERALCALHFEFADRPSTLEPLSCGRALHAGFLDLLRGADETIAGSIHDHPGVKPFSLSLLHPHQAGRGRVPARGIRVASLDPRLTALLLDHKGWIGREIRLRSERLRISRVRAEQPAGAHHPTASYQDLIDEAIGRNEAPDAHKIKMQFATPTTFRRAETTLLMPLPWPSLVFRSLEQKWNAYALETMQNDGEALERLVSISRHDVRTVMTDLGKYRQVGFIGGVEFVVHRDAPKALSLHLHTLAAFAQYAGVGAKTTMGMGRVISPGPATEPKNSVDRLI
jgi:CRISPR-associated endoribonuclease Cas6